MGEFLSGIVLAAGASSRMGRPKQLLPAGGRPLLQHVIDAALASRLDEVIVVLGHRAEEVRSALEIPSGDRVRVVVNPDYADGQSTSLRVGLRAASTRATAAAILLGDQPGLSAALIDRVAAAFLAGGRPAARPVFRGTAGRPVPGHPVLLARSVWEELEALRGDEGARVALARHPEWLLAVDIEGEPPGDVDTPADYERAGARVARPARPRRSRAARLWRRHVQKRFSRRLSALAAAVVPALYVAYMRFVWATSRVEPGNFPDLHRIIAEHNGAVGLLWHEEVMTVAFGYHYLGFRPHTLASIGESGEVIARMLKRCGFVVFRGGSTTGSSRRREGALGEMIEHMRTHDNVIYGLTVDGSKGPRYRMKTGGIVIARECGRPIVLARTWYRRCLRLPTWDRMALPLPFNVIRYYLKGPYAVPESARTQQGLERFRDQLEADLIELARQSYIDLGQTPPPELERVHAGRSDPGGPD